MYSANDWVYGIWFIAGDGVDWMATLFNDGDRWIFEHRLRYYDPESTDPHDGKDQKYWDRRARDGSTDVAILAADINEFAQTVRRKLKADLTDFVLFECTRGDPKFFFELASRPWAHPKIEHRGFEEGDDA
jgi:hypothetical protein